MPQDSLGLPEEDIHGGASAEMEAVHVLTRLVSAIEHTPMVAIQSFDRNGIIRLWNLTSADLYGIAPEDALGKPICDLLFFGDKKEEFDAAVMQMWESGRPVMPRDWQIETPSGSALWVYTTMFPVFFDGEADQIFCMDIDITQRKREAQALFSSGANFRAMFETSADAIMLLRNNHYIDVNPAALKLFACTEKKDIIGHGSDHFSPPVQPDGEASKAKLQEMCRLAQEHGNHCFEWMYINFKGQAFWAEKLLTAITVDGEPLIYAVIRDISRRKAAEQALHLAAKVFENSREGIMITDQKQRIISVNRAFTRITGYASEEALCNTPRMLSTGLNKPAFYEGLWQALANEDHWEGEIWDRRRNGESVPMWQSITVVRDANHRITNYFSIFSDISERKRAEDALLESEERFRGAFEAAAIGMALIGIDGRWLKVNESLCQILGYSEQELAGMTFHQITHPADLDVCVNLVGQLVAGEIEHMRAEKRYIHKNGNIVWIMLSGTLVRDAQGGPIHFVAQMVDITERKEEVARTRYLAEHDLLTGLPSRDLLLDRLRQAIAAARRNDSQLAILFIDLDRFKNVNDSMGHSIGDKLLREVAARLNQSVRGVDTVSRQGGDEFVILLSEIGGVEHAAHVARNVMRAIALPYNFDGFEFNVTSSIGISIYPADGQDTDTLIKNADVAMYHAKGSGRNSYHFFSSEMNTRIVERLALEKNLKRAIERNEFVLQYQPETDIASGRMIGAEALIRWQQPDSGLLFPADFIAVAEECGLIVPIGN